MASINKRLHGDLETVFLMAAEHQLCCLPLRQGSQQVWRRHLQLCANKCRSENNALKV